jgi:hypothetical protein
MNIGKAVFFKFHNRYDSVLSSLQEAQRAPGCTKFGILNQKWMTCQSASGHSCSPLLLCLEHFENDMA